DHGSNCTMKFGMPLSSFLSECVEVLSDAHKNDLLKRKAIGSAQHVGDTWVLDMSGVHPNFSAASNDAAPSASARANELSLDVRAGGDIKNEYSADGIQFTLAATGAIYREYARTVQDLLHSKMDASLPRFPIGDAHCLLPAGADPATWQ